MPSWREVCPRAAQGPQVSVYDSSLPSSFVSAQPGVFPSRFCLRASFRDQLHQTPAAPGPWEDLLLPPSHVFSRLFAPTEAEISNRIERFERTLLLYWFLIENGSPHGQLEMINTSGSTAISFRYHHHRQHFSFQPPQQIQKTSDLLLLRKTAIIPQTHQEEIAEWTCISS